LAHGCLQRIPTEDDDDAAATSQKAMKLRSRSSALENNSSYVQEGRHQANLAQDADQKKSKEKLKQRKNRNFLFRYTVAKPLTFKMEEAKAVDF
jgi:hypothetical protein